MMNSKIKIYILTFILGLNYVSAQVEIKTNALGLVTNNYNAQVELLLNYRSGIELELSYRNTPWILGLSGSEIKNNSFRFLTSYKYYLDSEDPASGLYFGPYLRLKVAGMENIPVALDQTYSGIFANPEIVKVINNAFTVGITGGQKIVFNNNFVLEYYAGIGYNPFNNIRIRDDIPKEIEPYLNITSNTFTWPWDFRLGFSLGYRIWR